MEVINRPVDISIRHNCMTQTSDDHDLSILFCFGYQQKGYKLLTLPCINGDIFSVMLTLKSDKLT